MSELWNDRTRLLLGDETIQRLANKHVTVVGLGGVGGYAVEMLARSGVGRFLLIDADCVAESNLNRQIIALRSTLNKSKVELFKQRIADINPHCEVVALQKFLTPENIAELIPVETDYVCDAIDTVASKVELIAYCKQNGLKLISSMGAGGRLDPSKVCYRDLWETADDGLARTVRQGLKKRGLHPSVQVVCSSEVPGRHSLIDVNEPGKRTSFGTVAAVPSVFGIFMAAKILAKFK